MYCIYIILIIWERNTLYGTLCDILHLSMDLLVIDIYIMCFVLCVIIVLVRFYIWVLSNTPNIHLSCSNLRQYPRHLRRMSRRILRRLGRWLLKVEMRFVWGVAGLSIFIFVFAAIWYIDPALLTLVLRFRQATCTTVSAAFMIGVSNCSWTSCK